MISKNVRCPSQRSSTCRPVPCNWMAPSGNRITRFSSLPPQRHPAARRGWLESSGGAISGFLLFDAEGARWRPAGLHVSKIESVELGPQNVALVAQRLDGQLLFGSRRGVVVNIVDRQICVFRGPAGRRVEGT